MPDGAEGVTARLTAFVAALREHGMQIGPAETVDAARSVAVLGLASREQLRHGLAAALIRREGSRSVFDAVFDVFFPVGVGLTEAARSFETGDMDDVSRLREQLADALAAGDGQRMIQLAQLAVELFGRVGSGDLPGQGSGSSGFSALRALDRVQPQTLIAGAEASLDSSGFTGRLTRDELRRLVETFRELVRAEARRRSAEVRGREQVARWSPTQVSEVDFLSANRAQLAELRRTVQPMARRLAGRLAARRRRTAHGQIDIRRTVRRSLSTGGVPLSPAYRRRRPGRPDIVLLCDVSGSVAGFAQFTLMLVEALHDQFSRVRSFAFVDSVDEITQLVEDSDADPGGLARRILAETAVARHDGHSDYGSAFVQFLAHYEEAIGPRTSVLVLGDARSNGTDPRLPAFRTIVGRARHAHWLNPEPERSWGTGDSLARLYGEDVQMHECRSARQLADVVSRLLPV
jgi:uncharacterized protein